jgi:hypothetical protein
MPLLRHNIVLLDQPELVEAPLVGRTLRIKPSDGDAVPDHKQRWWLVVELVREGDAMVSAVVLTSFDGAAWYPIATVPTRRNPAVVDLIELPALGPLLRVETRGQDVLPPHRLTVRLASDGPFSAVPA